MEENHQNEIIPLSLVLHGSWSDDVFFVWGESAEPAPKPRGRRPRVPPHPHAAPPERLRQALETLAPSDDWGDVPAATRVVLLPSGTDQPHPSPWLVIDAADVGTEAELHLSPWKVNGLVMDDPDDRARLRSLAQAMPPVCRALFTTDDAQANQAPAPHMLLDGFIKRVIECALEVAFEDALATEEA